MKGDREHGESAVRPLTGPLTCSLRCKARAIIRCRAVRGPDRKPCSCRVWIWGPSQWDARGGPGQIQNKCQLRSGSRGRLLVGCWEASARWKRSAPGEYCQHDPGSDKRNGFFMLSWCLLTAVSVCAHQPNLGWYRKFHGPSSRGYRRQLLRACLLWGKE